MFKSKLFYLPLILCLFFACDQSGYKTSDSGIQYKFLTKGEGAEPVNNEFVYINVSFKDDQDSTIFARNDVPLQKDSILWNSHNGALEELLNLCQEGDSVEAKLLADDLYAQTFKTELPMNIKKGSLISVNMSLSKILSEQAFMMEQNQARLAQVEEMRRQNLEANQEILQSDGEKIDTYLAKNNLKAEITGNGLRYVILKEGDGSKPGIGDSVKVDYTGQILEGVYFDTSIEADAKKHGLFNASRQGGYTPIEFQLGMGGVIHGWDEGLALLSKGAKAQLFIPSPMAYGAQQRSEEIVPNSILVFDVELVDFSSQ